MHQSQCRRISRLSWLPIRLMKQEKPVVDLEHIDQDDQVQWVPKRRFHSKKPLIPGSEDAALRMRLLCSNRGECNQEVPNSWEGSSYSTTSLNQCTSFDKEEALGKAWATLEHLHLRKLETEEKDSSLLEINHPWMSLPRSMSSAKTSRRG